MTATRPRTVTIDLDGAWCYRAIHGVADDDSDDDSDPILQEGVPRFLDCCARLNVSATLFVVGRDLQRPAFARLIAQAAAAGHDVMSHSFGHAYDLARFEPAALDADLGRSVDAITAVTGVAPRGFRAPGYTTSEALWAALLRAGFAWSSSVLPSPAYLAARTLVRWRTRAGGATSASQPGSWRAFSPLFATPPPPLREFPVSTALGLPWTGTTLALLPDSAADALTTLALHTPRPGHQPLVFELHAADFADGRHLPRAQPDARVPLADKLRRLERTLGRLARHQDS